MDPRSPRMTAAVRISSCSSSQEIPRPNSRSDSQTSSSSSSRPQDAVRIPGFQFDRAPPPLPPPRYNEELAKGIDTAWGFANRQDHSNTRTTLPPIKPGSSLLGERLQPKDSNSSRRGSDDMELDEDIDRRGSTVSTIRAASQSEITMNPCLPSLVTNPPSPTGRNYRLYGEQPLAQQNLNRSSQAYDQRVLSKIGKSNSPPQHLRSDSADSTTYTNRLSLQTKDSLNQRLPANEPVSASTDSLSRWATSPLSAVVSPGFKSTWREYSGDYRSSSIDSIAAPLILDPELFIPHTRRGSSNVRRDVSPGSDDTPNPASRGTRTSYDENAHSEHSTDYTSQEAGGFGSLNLDEPPSLVDSRGSRQGVKRRAPSPPFGVQHDDRPLGHHHNSILYQKINTDVPSRSPVARYQAKYGSVSSTASSARQNSLASSATFSAAGSSITSFSSYDRQSPSDPTHLTPSSATPASAALSPGRIMQRKPPTTNTSIESKSAGGKVSLQDMPRDAKQTSALRVGNHYICECCPKKPRKFETEAELRLHEAEKQYSCQYCNNRFKNKNEAERHQNSLHLRKQSWSCASIPSFHAAFHSTLSAVPQGQQRSVTDACGYCGEEFPNLPQPDWERRLDHITNVHKFAECNSSKKFYRADHFRQHLKHSHAGQPGKWTNMLETACLREEQPSEVISMSPSTSDTSPDKRSASISDAHMIDVDIDEDAEER